MDEALVEKVRNALTSYVHPESALAMAKEIVGDILPHIPDGKMAVIKSIDKAILGGPVEGEELYMSTFGWISREADGTPFQSGGTHALRVSRRKVEDEE